MTQLKDIGVVVVSHGHEESVGNLITQVFEFEGDRVGSVVVVDNLSAGQLAKRYSDHADVHVVSRSQRHGYGSNVNFGAGNLPGLLRWVAVVNPDISYQEPFLGRLADRLAALGTGGVVAPLLFNPATGAYDENARPYPSPSRILGRIARRLSGTHRDTVNLFPDTKSPLKDVDWVSGALMVMGRDWFRHLGGFSERYFMYGEDVDICVRTRARGGRVILDTSVTALHVGQRRSYRSWRHMTWHLMSLARLYLRFGFNPRPTSTSG